MPTAADAVEPHFQSSAIHRPSLHFLRKYPLADVPSAGRVDHLPRNMPCPLIVLRMATLFRRGRPPANNFGEIVATHAPFELLEPPLAVDHTGNETASPLILTSSPMMSSAGNSQRLIVPFGLPCGNGHASPVPRKPRPTVASNSESPPAAPVSNRKKAGHAIATCDGWGKSIPQSILPQHYIHIKAACCPAPASSPRFPDVDSSREGRFITTQPGQHCNVPRRFLNERQTASQARTTEAGP
jgi:hypothetical protein